MGTLTGGAAPQRPIPRSPEVKAFLYENAVIGETTRFRRINRYEAHYKCQQYQHLPLDWWGLSADAMETISPEVQVPFGFTQPAYDLNVRQKRPTAPYNLGKAVVDRFTGLLFSESRKPDVIVENDPDTEAFLLAVLEQMRFWPKMREVRTVGGSCGSVLVTVHVRDGRFALEVHNPKHISIVWKDRRTLSPLGVLKLYKYPVEEDVIDERTGEVKGTRIVEYLYRRIITEDDDTVYEPVKLVQGASLDWTEQSRVQHGLGFFPGVWIQNRTVLDDIDGDPDCHGVWQTLDTIDRLIAQMNKGTLLNLDPTMVLKIDPRELEMLGGSVSKGSDHAIHVGGSGEAKYMEMQGAGITVGLSLLAELKQQALDVTRCILTDPHKISGAAQSAKAIEFIYEPMLVAADELREQYGTLGVVPLLQIIERIARKYEGVKGTTAEGEDTVMQFNLPPRMIAEPVPAEAPPGTLPVRKQEAYKLGPGGYIRLQWGPYFAPTEKDKQEKVATTSAALGAGLIDQETAVKDIAPIYGVRDVDGMLGRIREEQDAQQQAAMGAAVSEEDLVAESEEDGRGPPALGGGKP